MCCRGQVVPGKGLDFFFDVTDQQFSGCCEKKGVSHEKSPPPSPRKIKYCVPKKVNRHGQHKKFIRCLGAGLLFWGGVRKEHVCSVGGVPIQILDGTCFGTFVHSIRDPGTPAMLGTGVCPRLANARKVQWCCKFMICPCSPWQLSLAVQMHVPLGCSDWNNCWQMWKWCVGTCKDL